MKKLIILLFSLLLIFTHSRAESIIDQANDAYSAANFEKAAQLYKDAINQNGESAIMYYNLGNTYYRLNQIAPAILSYERALLLDPGNKDIRFNLEIAKLKTVDKIESVGDFFLTEWFTDLRNLRNTDQWSFLGITSFLLFVVCLFLFFFSRKIILKKIGFFAGLLLVVICVFCNVFAFNQKKKLTERNTAIIFSATTTIKSSPDVSGTDLFILHEGTKVEVKNKVGDWTEIETADGNVGWIPTKEIEVI
ncbi:tetratricopeptide repeat protein [Bacteroidales bacterium OttesenSCG-928-M06]|nr:tetratricopeptide repeat protein [Bacteroidales bacterium OttesenSCG-928-M06]